MRTEPAEPAIYLITGVMAAGKSSVAQALAERLPLAAHVRGDLFRRMIVSGRAEMSNPLSRAAEEQLRLRHALAASVADGYVEAGISAVVQDLYLGPDLEAMIGMLTARPLHVVALCPSVEAVEQRELGRPKTGYDGWSPAEFDDYFRSETPEVGLWIDTSELTVDATVDAILAGSTESRVR